MPWNSGSPSGWIVWAVVLIIFLILFLTIILPLLQRAAGT